MATSGMERQRHLVAYMYVAPFFILFGVFMAFPIFQSLYLSFTYSQGYQHLTFVGLDNYQNLFGDRLFWKALYNTAFIWVFAHILILPGGFLLAYAINNVIHRGKDVFKAVFFTPLITSAVAVALVFSSLFGRNFGLINYVITVLGGEPVNWLGGSGIWIKPIVILLFAWRWIGYNMIIYIAGLQGIDGSLYESAYVEGATKLQMMIKITIPLMKPILFFTLFLSFIGGMQIFDEPFVLLQNAGGIGGGVDNQGLVLARYLYYQAFSRWNFGYASSIAYFMVVLVIILSAITRPFFRDQRN
jgi:ABC-type sugar transport system permease subunit